MGGPRREVKAGGRARGLLFAVVRGRSAGVLGSFYPYLVLAGFVGVAIGAMTMFKRAPRSKRWLGYLLLVGWALGVVAIPWLIGFQEGLGVTDSPISVQVPVAASSLGAALFGGWLWLQYGRR